MGGIKAPKIIGVSLSKINTAGVLNVLSIFTAISLVGFSIYFWGILPRKIRHDCSWVKVTNPPISARPAKTKDELRAEGLLTDCTGLSSKSYSESNKFNKYLSIFDFGSPKSGCEEENARLIEEYKTSQPEVAEKVWYRKASDDEYKFCLQDKGLIK